MKTYLKTGLVLGLASVVLTGCGSSSEEEQLAWMQQWNSMGSYDKKLAMLNTCFKQAGVKNMMQEMSDKQNDIFNECEIGYIVKKAKEDGVTMDEELIKANTLQM